MNLVRHAKSSQQTLVNAPIRLRLFRANLAFGAAKIKRQNSG
jgi:hypothetical protein